MLDQRELDKGIFFAPRPLAKKLLRHFVNVRGWHVASDDERAVVRHIVARLNQPHHRRRGGRYGLAIAQRLLAARVLVKQSIGHLLVQVIVGL